MSDDVSATILNGLIFRVLWAMIVPEFEGLKLCFEILETAVLPSDC